MKALEQSILESLDGFQTGLFPYLPYILQDLWEMGSDPETMFSLVKNHINKQDLRILDLGCGKGAVSIKLARELDCTVLGIDGMPDFIARAREAAMEYGVSGRCIFETGDIREKIGGLTGFDLVVLGAIGQALGDVETTLKTVRLSLNPSGYVLLDDGYIADDSPVAYNRCLRKSDFYDQIDSAGFRILKEAIIRKETMESNDKTIYASLERRVNELKELHPEKEELFNAYLKSQQFENQMLETEITGGAWLLRRTPEYGV